MRINNQYIHHLSTDERDRVGFARALVLPGCVSDFFFRRAFVIRPRPPSRRTSPGKAERRTLRNRSFVLREGHMHGVFLSGVSKSRMQMNLERSINISFFFFTVSRGRRSGDDATLAVGVMKKPRDPPGHGRGGEAPSVTSRGEHG